MSSTQNQTKVSRDSNNDLSRSLGISWFELKFDLRQKLYKMCQCPPK